MTGDKVVTRFPPSPTGYLHIGGARTALFNWLYARQNNGTFILRIEDTDKVRSTEEATSAILGSMEWLGLDWDDGPYFQSQRSGIYEEFIERLISSGMAYHCHCTPEELEERRKEAMSKGLKPKYNGRCRDLNLGPAPGSVIRLKAPQKGDTGFKDLVKGYITFDNEQLDDLIIKRSDGSPTYHLAVVADDITMGITHVIRGDDHVNNTPRQIHIYQALGEPLPQYIHVPMILGPDRTRLSKRHGATSVMAYKDMGYLPHALLNSLARLGWSHGDQEKFSIDELIDKFSIKNIGKSAGIFNPEKLLDLNAQYIRETETGYLVAEIIPFLDDMGCKNPGETKVFKAVETLKVRSRTLKDMAEDSLFYFLENISYDDKADKKFLKTSILPLMEEIRDRLEKAMEFSINDLEETFRSFLEEKDIKLGKIAQPLRVALTGKTVSPGIFEVMDVLGKEETIKRLDRALSHIREKKD